MNRSVLGVLIGIPTLATVGVGSTYAGTSKTWKAKALSENTWEERADSDPWGYEAQEVPGEWKDYFECCCKDGQTCTSCATDSDGTCPADEGNQCTWKVKESEKQNIKNQCESVGSRILWALNDSVNKNANDYRNYLNVCLKQKSTSGETGN